MATQTGSIDLRGVKQSYEGVEIGGRNLIWDGRFGNTTDKWTNWGSPTTREVVEVYNKRWLHLKTTTTTYQGYSQNETKRNGIYEVTAGDAVTISCEAYAASNCSVSLWGIHWKDSSGTTLSQSWGSNSVATTPKKYSATYTVPNNAVAFNVMIGDNTTTALELWITDVKLEKGTKATTWTPAPEDVQEGIDNAQTAANDAQSTANNAQTTANDAQNAANTAQTAADNAAMSASDAAESANNAQIAADEAKSSISNIEYIVGASSWVTEHGIYNKSTDTTVDATKKYYTVSATAVSNPTGSPHKGLYYERSNNVYTLTSDDIVVSGKTYYTLAATLVGSPTGNPSSNGYYEQRLNESIEDYLSTHIRTNADGLFVTDGSASQVRINSSGVSIWNGEEQIASYGSVAQVGALNKFHILIGGEENEIGFYFGDSKMAYLNGDELYVQNSLSFGNEPFATFTFYQRANGHFTLKLVNQE